MANEKQNNVRILQSTQKKSLHPAIHAVWGFFAGVTSICMALLMYINLNSRNESDSQSGHYPEERVILPHTQPALTEYDENQSIAMQMPKQAEIAETVETESVEHFTGDLMNAFKHENTVQPTAQRHSPSGYSQMQAPTPPAARKQTSAISQRNLSAIKPVIKTQTKNDLGKTQTQSALPTAITPKIDAEESEVPGPRASLQVTVTKTLSPIKEPAAVP